MRGVTSRDDRLERLVRAELLHLRDAHRRARREDRAREAEVLRVGRDDLVVGPQAEPGEHDVAAVRRRVRERHVLRRRGEKLRDEPAKRRARRLHLLDVLLAAAAELDVVAELLRDDFRRRPRERAERSRVEVRDALEDRKQRARFVERHATTRSTGV